MAFPDWVMLDPYVFRDGPFPDDDPTAAIGHNSRGDKVGVRFLLRAPPEPSSIFLDWEAGTGDCDDFSVVAAHRDAVLFQMGYLVSLGSSNAYKAFDYLLYRAAGAGGSSPSLDLLAPFGGSVDELKARMEADGLIRLTNQHLRRLKCLDIGVLCRDGEEFAVAELQITRSEVGPELHVLRSSTSSRKWELKRPPITPANGGSLDLEKFLWDWDADTVIPFGSYLCWVDYCLGILFCDMFDENPQLHYLEFPADVRGACFGGCCQAVGVTNGVMKLVSLVPDDGLIAENYTPESGFTIVCWTLRMDEMDKMVWEKDAVLKSDHLWSMLKPDFLWPLDEFRFITTNRFPRVQFPLISIDDSSVIYLVLAQNGRVEEAGYNYDETWLLAIDMSKMTLKMSFPYIEDEMGDPSPEMLAFAEDKFWRFEPFLAADFSRHFNLRCPRHVLLKPAEA
uniref:DUF1618 domain-containing protein n=1 Tax=Oryza barthii TaxID=65489 RepID=A0A0D3HV80_9ORYZ